MKIADLKILAELQPRLTLNEDTIAHYIEILDQLPAVTVQKGTNVLVDGFHLVD